MFNGVMLLWFILTTLPVLFVAVDIRATPESKVLKWGFGGRCWAPLCIASPGMGLAL